VKKTLFLLLVIFFCISSPASAAPKEGTQMIGLHGYASLNRDYGLNMFLYGQYGRFIQDGLLLSGDVGINVYENTRYGTEYVVHSSVAASYWLELRDGLDLKSGIQLSFPVEREINLYASVNIGLAKWIAEKTALTADINLSLGKIEDIDELNDPPMAFYLGVAQFF